MNKGIQIARIFGINIRLDWSWLLIFVLIVWNLATVFSGIHAEWGTLLNWGMAILAAILFFASILLHELAHSLVAKARGIPVSQIRLFLFGGVSNIEREPPSPGIEFFMALVGPLTSLVLGFVLIAIGNMITPIGQAVTNPSQLFAQWNPLTTLLMWLGSINILLGVFNLIPGFPLDGGRILRSLFWVGSKDLRKATRWASWVGQGIAWLMILTGIAMVFGVQIPFFGSGIISGLWLVFIGWFLNSNAAASYRQIVIQDILEDVPVERLMRPNPPTVPSSISVDSLVQDGIMATDDHAFPVVDENRLVGLVTIEDIRGIPRSSWNSTTVRQIMTPKDQLVSVTLDEDAAEALNKLQTRDVNQLPVMRDGSLAGLLRRRDIIKWLQLHSELSR
jgi:Zn-dependent protease/CBS domain-containing protein